MATCMRASRLSLLVLSLMVAPIVARADTSCADVMEAGLREVQTPHHMHMLKGGAESGESVYDGKAIYVRVNGKWRKSAADPADTLATAREQRAKPDAACTRVASETIDGQSAVRWHIAPDADSEAEPSDVWIGADGLPIHQRVTSEGVVRDVRIDYHDVATPSPAG